MNLHNVLAAYRIVKAEDEYQKKLKAFIGKELDYDLLQQIANRAQPGITITIQKPGAALVTIKREDAYDKWKQDAGRGYGDANGDPLV